MNRGTKRNGVGLAYAIVIMVALCAMASLAIDFGRVHVTRTQLRSACDAAALAAGQMVLTDPSAARNAAIETARANFADGKRVQLQAGDVQFIEWDAEKRTHKPATAGRANAVLVTAYRTAERGNPVDLPFARLIGQNTCNVRAHAIAMATPTKHGVVGIDFIKMTGNSSAGTVKRDGRGSMASNGDIVLTGSAFVDGAAHPGVGRAVIGANKVNGSVTPLTKPLVYPQANAGNAAGINDNSRLGGALKNGSIVLGSQQRVELPAGTYYVKDVLLGAGSTLHFSGKATLYVTGRIDLKGHAKITAVKPADLKLTMLGTGSMTLEINGSCQIHADIYAPGAALTMHGTGDIYGSLVAKSIDITGNTGLHYDMGLRGGVMLVE